MKVEIRSNDCAVISGYVNAVERRSRVISRPGAPPFREIVRPGTFRKALESGDAVELKLNHERTLCDTTSGLELREDNVGLYAKAEINDRETVEAARAGRLTGWSFGFVCRADTWKKDEDGTELRELDEIRLDEVSILKQYEEELNFKLLTAEQIAQGYRFKFNVAAVLRGDTKAQVESLCQGISSGLYTLNEARRCLDLPSKDGGDRIYFNGSNVAVEDAGVQYALPSGRDDDADQQQDNISEHTKALLKLAESVEKAAKCGIISIKGGNGWENQDRDEHGRWASGGGSSSSDGTGGGREGASGQSEKTVTNAAGQTVRIVDHICLTGEQPNSITQRQNAKGGIDRNYYDANGRQVKQISNHDHGHPKQHPFGKHGEHAHDYLWNEAGQYKSRTTRELTDQERKDEGDLL